MSTFKSSELLTVGDAPLCNPLLTFNDSTKQIAYITPEHEIIIDATAEELEQLVTSSDQTLKGWAIVFREIRRLRSENKQLASDADRWRWCYFNIRKATHLFTMLDYEGGDTNQEMDNIRNRG